MTNSNDGTQPPATYVSEPMDADLERKAESVFHELAEARPADRAVVLAHAENRLRQRVERLLALHDASCDPGLRTPALELSFYAPASPSLPTPTWIGPYEIMKTLGEGGMGVVYLAEQTKPIHRRVALKVIKLGMDTKAVMARFEAEREALALMNHPNVARVIDAGATDEGRPYFVMEFVEGVPINQFCDQQRLSLTERLNLFRQVCEAVQHAHQKGIIHRDLKPSNVLVTLVDGKPAVKVIDFGIAKATQQKLTDQTFATERGLIVGTPAYMSPEQADPASQDIDTRTDIYSLGVMLYELLVGVLPLDPDVLRKAALSEIQRLIHEVDPPKPSSRVLSERRSSASGAQMVDHDAPLAHGRGTVHDVADCRKTDPKSLIRQVRGDLDWIVMKCLEKDRTRRYETANALVMDLQHYLNHEPVTAGPPSRAYRLRKFVRRNQGAATAASLIVLVLLGGLAGTSVMFARARAAEERERSQRIRAEEGEARAEQGRAESEQVAQFLGDMLAAADPREQGKDVTVLEVLENSAKSIGVKFSDRPLIEAPLQRTVGRTYRALGMFDQAEQHLAQAAKIYARAVGPRDARTLNAVNAHATILQQAGHGGQTEGMLRSTLEMQRQIQGEAHRDTLATMNNLANVLWDQGRFVEAEELYRKNIEIGGRALGPQHPDTLRAMGNLASSLSSVGRHDEAEQLQHLALDLKSKVLGAEHSDTLWSLNALANTLHSQGKYAEAEALHRQTLEIRTRRLTQEHPETLSTMEALARDLLEQGRMNEAEELYRGTLETRSRILGPEHRHTLGSMSSLANCYLRQGRIAEAEEVYHQTLGIQRRILGNDHPAVADSLHGLATALEIAQRYAEAEAVCREADSIMAMRLPPKHRSRKLNASLLGAILCGLGRYPEAEPLLLESQRGLKDRTDVSSKMKHDATQRIVDLYTSWHAAEPNKGFDVKALEWSNTLTPPDSK